MFSPLITPPDPPAFLESEPLPTNQSVNVQSATGIDAMALNAKPSAQTFQAQMARFSGLPPA
ncbi:hypothetical protein FRC09_020710 [Ceratobasidium sp. 395]|nr:hypothetical protein FRC09_020710 [Ceratobasidium sp. 395]